MHAHRVAAFCDGAVFLAAPTDARTSHDAGLPPPPPAAAPPPPSPYYLSRDGGFGAGGAECVFLEGAAPLAVA